ncbi:MAG: hypothetical protein WKG07_44725 [Hymenobacter sp.]
MKNARLDDHEASVDIGIVADKIQLLEAGITAPSRVVLDAENQFVCAELLRNPHSPRQILHPGPLLGGKGHEGRSLHGVEQRQEELHGGGRVCAGQPRGGDGHQKRHNGPAHLRGNGPRAGLRSFEALKRVREAWPWLKVWSKSRI